MPLVITIIDLDEDNPVTEAEVDPLVGVNVDNNVIPPLPLPPDAAITIELPAPLSVMVTFAPAVNTRPEVKLAEEETRTYAALVGAPFPEPELALLTHALPVLVSTLPTFPGATSPVPPLEAGMVNPMLPLLMVTFANVRLLSVVTVLPSKTDVLPMVIGVLKLLSNLLRAMFPLRFAKAYGTVIRTSLSIRVQIRKYSQYIQHYYC